MTEHPKSLRNVKVSAKVVPQGDEFKDAEKYKKISKGLKKEVEKVIADNDDLPSGEQVGKAAEVASSRKEELENEAGEKLDAVVIITGERGDDGDTEVHFVGSGDAPPDIHEVLDNDEEDD